ncbi:hypothetical protein CIT292_07637 [Citrobacter youngae ATCC 29220]|uniref:Uncharacterized protein n=1 Tax=Citrobacter youngae ATCC 29220 TaxID=500640 RepID=D4BAY9_9ENTR|nr:hypothetical protein CIT292_07637 [Citrobacter youngae ATCC 29220]
MLDVPGALSLSARWDNLPGGGLPVFILFILIKSCRGAEAAG